MNDDYLAKLKKQTYFLLQSWKDLQDTSIMQFLTKCLHIQIAILIVIVHVLVSDS